MPVYELHVDSHFAAAHSLRGYRGECSSIHGHTWRVTATVRTTEMDTIGMTVDFKAVSRALEDIIGRFDHANLNDLDLFSERNPTAENIARLIFGELEKSLDAPGARVHAVTVAESERYRVTYYGNDE